ncbi:unnamed protein product, partial [Meganyctiphanes norvegica]
SVMHCGSSYEGLVVKAKSDFDMPLILSDPFAGSNFLIIRDPKTQLFQLEWNHSPPAEYNKYCDGKFLNAKELQKHIFERIQEITKKIHLAGWTLEAKTGLAAVAIKLERDENTIPIDLAPQIAVRKWDGPDLLQLSSLPPELGDYITILHKNASPIFFFSP